MLAVGDQPRRRGVVDHRAQFAERPAQRAARIVGQFPEHLAQPFAPVPARAQGKVGEQRSGLARSEYRHDHSVATDLETAQQRQLEEGSAIGHAETWPPSPARRSITTFCCGNPTHGTALASTLGRHKHRCRNPPARSPERRRATVTCRKPAVRDWNCAMSLATIRLDHQRRGLPVARSHLRQAWPFVQPALRDPSAGPNDRPTACGQHVQMPTIYSNLLATPCVQHPCRALSRIPKN